MVNRRSPSVFSFFVQTKCVCRNVPTSQFRIQPVSRSFTGVTHPNLTYCQLVWTPCILAVYHVCVSQCIWRFRVQPALASRNVTGVIFLFYSAKSHQTLRVFARVTDATFSYSDQSPTGIGSRNVTGASIVFSRYSTDVDPLHGSSVAKATMSSYNLLRNRL